ncbi:rod shape-determining protein MreC [Cyanobacterium sp. uoEpiScrs1]|uniref:rod shape-determining protein MreC n=1 Tax=Cyanobacterium sp. uoEpiScrs1 TaxID=2976343 RepID=UPI00226A15C1|nr:rod shape-determining protein MreC [Cyanobacterium sp. uoEpiScrs1]
MLIVRRWYVRYGSKLMWAVVSVGVGWFFRQTQGAPILELYYWLSLPFKQTPPVLLQERLTNARIQELEMHLAELERQNKQLRKLLGYFETQSQSVITAPIIGRSADDWWRQVILGRGSQDGVEVGFIVTGIGGIIGRVVDVTIHTSRVLLVSDPTSRVGATVSRSRTMGLVEGKGSQIVVMRFFEKVPKVHPGDIITTSPVSRIFPGGLPIGRVESVNFEGSPAPQAVIKLTAPINDLEWAIITPFDSK